MPLPQYSPWQEASMGVNRLGNSIGDITMEIAKQRYAQQVMQQRLALQQQALQERQRVDESQMAYDKARSERQGAAKDIDTERLGSARRFGAAMGRQVPRINPMTMGEGPSINAARVQEEQDAAIQAAVEAAMAAHLSGNPQRATTFAADQEALRAVQPMNPRLGAARLTNTRSSFPVPAGAGVYDMMDDVIRNVTPNKPSVPRTGVPPVLTPSAALGARTGLMFDSLPPEMQAIIDQTITNAPGSRPMQAPAPVQAPMAAPQVVPPPEQRPVGFTTTTAKGTFRWNGQSWDPVR